MVQCQRNTPQVVCDVMSRAGFVTADSLVTTYFLSHDEDQRSIQRVNTTVQSNEEKRSIGPCQILKK